MKQEKNLCFAFLFLLIMINACTNSPTTVPFPTNETEFAAPKVKTLGEPKVLDLKPRIVSLTGNRPDSVLPPEVNKMDAPEKRPYRRQDSLIEELPTIVFGGFNEWTFKDVRKVKTKPKVILLGEPVKIVGKIPVPSQIMRHCIRTYQEEQGLPYPYIQGICKDSLGNIWLGTMGGLCCFDGQQWWKYTVKQGLANNHVISVKFSSRGELLLGTSGGGLEIIDVRKKIISHYGKAEGLADAVIWDLLEGKSGEIYLGTYLGGLNVLDAERKTISIYDSKINLNNDVRCIIETRKGEIVIGTAWQGAVILDLKKNKASQFSVKQGLKSEWIRTVCEDTEGKLYLGCTNGFAHIFDRGKNTLQTLNLNYKANDNKVHTIKQSTNGTMLFGTANGLFMLSKNVNDSAFNFDKLTKKDGLSANSVMNFLEEKNGDLLVTTGEGLNFFRSNKFYRGMKFTPLTEEHGLKNASAKYIARTANDILWIATGSEGVAAMPKPSQTQNNFTYFYGPKPGVFPEFAYGLEPMPNGEVMVASNIAGLFVLNPKDNSVAHYGMRQGFTNEIIRVTAQDAEGNCYLGTEDGLHIMNPNRSEMSIVTTKEGLGSKPILGIHTGKDRKVLLACYGGGLNILDERNKKIIQYSTKQGLGNDFLWAVYRNSYDDYFVGSAGGGLDVLDIKNKKIFSFGAEQGLQGDRINFIIEDTANVMWIGTNSGLAKIVRENNSYRIVRTFDKSSGLVWTITGSNAVCLSKTNSIYAVLGSVVHEFDPYQKSDTSAIPVYITDVNVKATKEKWFNNTYVIQQLNSKDSVWTTNSDTSFANGAIPTDTSYFAKNRIAYDGVEENMYHLPKNLVVPYDQNHLTFSFVGICISAFSDRVRYRYVLEGLDRKWGPITEKFEADYRNIPPGEYIFKVCARNLNGKWSQPAEFKFTVLSPWYQTKLAIAIYVLMFFASLYIFSNWRNRSLQARQTLMEKKIEEATQEIKEQKQLIEEKQKELIDSINYASRIQRALITSEKYISRALASLTKKT